MENEVIEIEWVGCECNPTGLVYYDAPDEVTEGGFTLQENKLQVYPEWLYDFMDED